MSKKRKCGIVTIVGRPNVGKSTLINAIIDEKIAIVSPVPQTTRQQVRGIYNDKRGQIIFIDTPGIHLAKDTLGKMMNNVAQGTLDADCVIHLVDSSKPTGQEEEIVVSNLKELNVPIIVGLNKIDLKGKYIDLYIALWEKATGKPISEIKNLTFLPVSGKSGKNIDKMIDILFDLLQEGPLLYPLDIVSDSPQKLAISDIIREKLFWTMREEVPHSIGVIVREMLPRTTKLFYINAVIYVERESQKEIVIGKKGQVMKNVGTLAREELEKLLNRKVFLELTVQAEKNWRDNPSVLEEMGFSG